MTTGFSITALLTIASLLFTQALYADASPDLRLCRDDCSSQQNFQLSTDSWQQIKNLFTPAPKSATRERQQLATAVALMEQDIMAQNPLEDTDTTMGGAYKDAFSNRDETRNTGNFIALLLDQQLLQKHLLRRSAKRQSLFGVTQTATVLQDLQDGELFAIDTRSTEFGKPPVIEPLGQWKNGTPIKKLGRNISDFIFAEEAQAAETESNEQ